MQSDETVLFENAEWTVTAAGLEHKGNGYFIEREGVGQRRSDGLWTWPLHMLEKAWCAPHPFAEAFVGAVRAYELPAGPDLRASFAAALGVRLDPVAIVCLRSVAPHLRRDRPAAGADWAWIRPDARASLRGGASLHI